MTRASPRVAALTAKGGDRVAVELDDGRTLDVALEVADEARLRAGDPVDAQFEARLLESDLRVRARNAALSLLSVRARSRTELADRLRRKEFPRAIVQTCLDDLEGAGWLDDAAFARGLVRDRLRLRPRGPGRMAQELRGKGVDDAVARDAVDEVFREESVSVPTLAVDVARGWLRRQGPSVRDALLSAEWSDDRTRAQRRLHSFLARRGFTGAVARAALETLRAEARE